RNVSSPLCPPGPDAKPPIVAGPGVDLPHGAHASPGATRPCLDAMASRIQEKHDFEYVLTSTNIVPAQPLLPRGKTHRARHCRWPSDRLSRKSRSSALA